MQEYIGLEETLESVMKIEGVEFLGRLTDRQPSLKKGERHLALYNQIMKARVDDATSPEWYKNAVINAGSGTVIGTYLIKLPESALDEVLGTFANNEKITFNLPDKKVIRPEWN